MDHNNTSNTSNIMGNTNNVIDKIGNNQLSITNNKINNYENSVSESLISITDNKINDYEKRIACASIFTMKTYSIETTVTGISTGSNDRFLISCNPYIDTHWKLYLKKDHPNFIDFYNKLQIGKTYNFRYITSFWEQDEQTIIDILPCNIYSIRTMVKGFLNIKTELGINNYSEIVTNIINNKHRLLIHEDEMHGIIIGKTYMIYYTKEWKKNLYLVTKCELCN